jgi:hypothetical protein
MPINDFEANLVTFLDQQYALTGTILSAEKAFKEYGIPVPKYKSAMENPDVRRALSERGIIFERFDVDDWTSKSLTPIQLLVANSLLDLTDTRTNKKKLQDLEVSTQTYNAWLKDPVFKDYIHKRASQMIGENEHEVDLALLDRIRSGDLKAIAYYNEMTGRFVPQRASSMQVDPVNLVTKILEIITEEVSDPKELMNISNRLKSMIAARTVAGALVGEEEPIMVPEIAPTRKELPV